MEDVRIFVGNIIHCTGRFEMQVVKNGFIIVNGNKIAAIGKNEDLSSARARLNVRDGIEEKVLKKSQIIIPGFVDTHIHAAQYPNCGLGYDKPLLGWLETYTYKLERKYDDQEFSRKVFDAIVRITLDNGTTTACYFASLFNKSSMILVDAAIRHSQRALIGKINMTTLAPDDYKESPEESLENTQMFIGYVKSQESDLVKPVITPRFALSVDMDLMKKLGDLAAHEDLHIQSHISENTNEVEMVKSKYNMLYANVYDEAHLLTTKIMSDDVDGSDRDHPRLCYQRVRLQLDATHQFGRACALYVLLWFCNPGCVITGVNRRVVSNINEIVCPNKTNSIDQ